MNACSCLHEVQLLLSSAGARAQTNIHLLRFTQHTNFTILKNKSAGGVFLIALLNGFGHGAIK